MKSIFGLVIACTLVMIVGCNKTKTCVCVSETKDGGTVVSTSTSRYEIDGDCASYESTSTSGSITSTVTCTEE